VVWRHAGAARRRGRDAEAWVHDALDSARWQQAKSRAPRAAMSLTRRWQQGKRPEARQLLADIYSWVTESFDTADLPKPKPLLQELSCPSPSPWLRASKPVTWEGHQHSWRLW
jgi:hypothetical protein